MKRKNGMTLNELIIAMFISTIVLISIFALYFLGLRVFADGRKEFQMQKAVRDAFEIITREARWARDLQIISNEHVYNSNDEGFKFITIDASSIQRFVYEGSAKIMLNDLTDPVINNLEFKIDTSESILYLYIESENDNINIKSSVKVFNTPAAGLSEGVGIKYK